MVREKLSSGGRGITNDKGADQSAHMRRLIGASLVRFLECNMYKLATGKLSNF